MPWMSINEWKKKCKIGLQYKPKAKIADKGNGRKEKPKVKEQGPDLPFKVLGFDTFSSEWYSLGSFHAEEKALAVAQAKLRVLEHTQPSASSGGQAEMGIQDRVFIEGPDGARRRVLG